MGGAMCVVMGVTGVMVGGMGGMGVAVGTAGTTATSAAGRCTVSLLWGAGWWPWPRRRGHGDAAAPVPAARCGLTMVVVVAVVVVVVVVVVRRRRAGGRAHTMNSVRRTAGQRPRRGAVAVGLVTLVTRRSCSACVRWRSQACGSGWRRGRPVVVQAQAQVQAQALAHAQACRMRTVAPARHR